jgi:large subunit ribosomal protein L9
MDVILLERIENLGQMGDVVKVKNGFARNFLLPKRKALRATELNRKQFEAQRAQLEATNLERRKEAEKVSTKVEGLTVVLVRQAGEGGQLYGSVSGRDVADAVVAGGVTVDRSQILLDRPIKAVGLHDVRVQLHPEVIVTIKANVARTVEEAEIQARTGRAVVGLEDEEQKREATIVNAEKQLDALFEQPLDEEAKGELTGQPTAKADAEEEPAPKPKKRAKKKAKDAEEE